MSCIVLLFLWCHSSISNLSGHGQGTDSVVVSSILSYKGIYHWQWQFCVFTFILCLWRHFGSNGLFHITSLFLAWRRALMWMCENWAAKCERLPGLHRMCIYMCDNLYLYVNFVPIFYHLWFPSSSLHVLCVKHCLWQSWKIQGTTVTSVTTHLKMFCYLRNYINFKLSCIKCVQVSLNICNYSLCSQVLFPKRTKQWGVTV